LQSLRKIGDNKAMAARFVVWRAGNSSRCIGRTFPIGWIVRMDSAQVCPPDKAESGACTKLEGRLPAGGKISAITPSESWPRTFLGFVDLDEKGLGGIEYQLDSAIRGKKVKKIVVMEGCAATLVRWRCGAKGIRGANVVLTIDEKIQYIAEARNWRRPSTKTHALAGTVIVQNPNDGAILALANWPKFNPNTPQCGNKSRRTDGSRRGARFTNRARHSN